jgi:hypothetical protein
MALIHGFAACDIGRIILRVEERSEQKTDESHAQGNSECRQHIPRDDTHHGLLALLGRVGHKRRIELLHLGAAAFRACHLGGLMFFQG